MISHPIGFPHDGTHSEQAFFWLLHIKEGDVSDDELSLFDRWLENSENAIAYRKAAHMWKAMGYLNDKVIDKPSSDHIVVDLNAARQKDLAKVAFSGGVKRLLPGIAIAASLIIGVVVWGVQNETSVSLPSEQVDSDIFAKAQEFSTMAGQMETIELADGSIIEMSGGSKIKVAMSATQRSVQLVEGQAYFDVSPDKDRPFNVNAGPAKVTVLGTEFDIRKGMNNVTVSVAEGHVKVQSTEGLYKQLPAEMLTVGKQIKIENDGIMLAVRDTAIERVVGWRTGRLFYEDVYLEDLVEDVNRLSALHVDLASDDLKRLKVTVSFGIEQTETAIEKGVAKSLGLEVVRENNVLRLQKPA